MSKTVVLIPTYNERENISMLVPEIVAAHPELSILVIDDNSPDGTGAAVREMAARYPQVTLLSREKKEGLGAAYTHAMTHVLQDPSVDRIVTMDADGSHSVTDLGRLLAASESYELVIGSRYVRGGKIESWVLWRLLLSRWGNRYARFVTGLPIRDMTAGFLCMRRSLLGRLDLDAVGASGYAFLMDLKFHAIAERGAEVKEIPILLKARREGESKISTHIIREGLLTPWRLRLRRFQRTI